MRIYQTLLNESLDTNIGRLLPKPCEVLDVSDCKDYLNRLVAEDHRSVLEDIRTVVETMLLASSVIPSLSLGAKP
jgi:hypothetical protein